FYYLVTASIFDSKFRGDDKVWRDTRYNKSFSVNLLIGKEFYTKKDNIWGLNARANFLGGGRYDGIDEVASVQAKRIIYDSNKIFENQYPSNFFLDLSITYRINKAKYSSTFALQVKNALGTPAIIDNEYNYKKKAVEQQKMVIMIPVLSYKIDF
ncbi:MAG TPA: TonB-dependent receptor, partial [Bacteroidales bacterium]